MARRAAIGKLPTELLMHIMSYMSAKETLALGSCNQELHLIIESLVFRDDVLRNTAMTHALRTLCLGLINRLVTVHNASPTVVYRRTASISLNWTSRAPRYGLSICRVQHQGKFYSVRPSLYGTPPYKGNAPHLFAHLTLRVLAKLDTTEMDGEKRTAYYEAWKLLLGLGARLSLPTDNDEPDQPSTKEYFRRETHKLFKEILAQPTPTRYHAKLKANLVRLYYDVLRHRAMVDLGIGPATIFQNLPRHIYTKNPDVVIAEILKQEKRIAPVTMAQDDAPLLDKHGTALKSAAPVPLVDRPVKLGQRSELLSPLSAAILADNRPVFSVLMQHGASINGITIDYVKHSPKKYNLHIPIFAAAYVAATDFRKGLKWIELCLQLGANANHLHLGRLNSEYYISSNDDDEHRLVGYCHWVTPLDVYLSMIPRRRLRRSANRDNVEEDTELDKVDKLLEIDFTVDHAARQRVGGVVAPQARDGHDPTEIRHACGTIRGKNSHSCNLHGIQLCRAPSAAEIIIERLDRVSNKDSAGFGLARNLMFTCGSGRDFLARIFMRYEASLAGNVYYPVSRRSGYCENADLAKLFFYALRRLGWTARELGCQMGHYIVYRLVHNATYTDTAIAIMNQYEIAAFSVSHDNRAWLLDRPSGPVAPPIDFNPIYINMPDNAAFEDYRVRICGSAPDRFNAYPVEGWTTLHEICRQWRIQCQLWDEDRDDQDKAEYNKDMYKRMKLLMFLISKGVDVYVVDANGDTPMDVLVKNDDHALGTEAYACLANVAEFIKTTWACYNIGMQPVRALHKDLREKKEEGEAEAQV